MKNFNVGKLETKPEYDPYANLEGVSSRTFLKLDPEARKVWVTQEYRDNSTPMREWNRLVLSWYVPGHPREEAMRQWIEETMQAFTTICDGFERVWNGHNHVGSFSEDAREQVEAIEYDLDNDAGPVSYYEFWEVESWLEASRDEIRAEMTDDELADLAKEWEGGDAGEIVLSGDILEFVISVRDILRDEQEEEK